MNNAFLFYCRLCQAIKAEKNSASQGFDIFSSVLSAARRKTRTGQSDSKLKTTIHKKRFRSDYLFLEFITGSTYVYVSGLIGLTAQAFSLDVASIKPKSVKNPIAAAE